MDFSAVCRTCLKDEYLNPVFPNSKEFQRYSNAVYITTGIKIGPNDGLPQQICSHCIHFINQSLKFRKTCKDVQIMLLENIETAHKINIINKHERKDFLVFSGNNTQNNNMKIETDMRNNTQNNNIKIEAETVDLNSTESNEHKIEFIEDEAITDDEEDKLPISLQDEKETPNIKSDKHIPTIEISDPDLNSLHNTSKVQTKRVVCKLCQKNLSVRSIDAHMDKAHPGADDRKIKCELCDSYLMKHKMARHIKMKHGIKKGQERNGRCGYCKTEFDSKEELIQHVANCTAKKKKRKVPESSRQLVKCEVCDKKMQQGSLRLHKAMAHAGMKIICEHCGQSFGTKIRLNEHYRAKHGYDKFKCSYCDFETASLVSLQNHTRKHLGEKPFVCETCGAKFHAAYLLIQHKASHRTERAYKCEICSSSFKSANSLHIHKKACHSTAVYKCVVCPKTFSCRVYVVKHMRRAHRFNGPVPDLAKMTDDDVDHVES